MRRSALITRDFNGLAFSFRPDGWFNMTKAAAHFGKTLENFMRSPETLEYIEALSNSVKNTEIKEARKGRYGGTWAHPKLAVFFARWLDVRFAVWCDAAIEDILKGAAVCKTSKSDELVEVRRGAGGGTWAHTCAVNRALLVEPPHLGR